MQSAPHVLDSTEGPSRRVPGWLASTGRVLGHSLFPFAALGIIAGTLVWGPWVTLLLTLVWWKIVTRIG